MPLKPKNNPQPYHLSSNEPIIFFTQILILASVIFMVAYLLFVYSWTSQQKFVSQQPMQTETGEVDPQLFRNGIDESQFFETPNFFIEQSKLEDLFPEVK